MKYIVDRIEGDYAVCESEDRTMVSIPLGDLPSEVKEGTKLIFEGTEYSILAAGDERRKHIKSLMEDLWTK